MENVQTRLPREGKVYPQGIAYLSTQVEKEQYLSQARDTDFGPRFGEMLAVPESQGGRGVECYRQS